MTPNLDILRCIDNESKKNFILYTPLKVPTSLLLVHKRTAYALKTHSNISIHTLKCGSRI